MPKFINTLYDIVQSEKEERPRAIRDTGNYRQGDRYSHHKVDINLHWATIAQAARHKKVKRFLTDDGKANSNTVVSNDGNRAVQGMPTAGKKRVRGNVNVLSFQQYQMLKENYSREG